MTFSSHLTSPHCTGKQTNKDTLCYECNKQHTEFEHPQRKFLYNPDQGHGMEPKSPDSSRQSSKHEAEMTSAGLVEDDAPSTLAKEDDQGVIPHATASAIQVAEDVMRGAKAAVGETVAWTEAKVSKLSAKEEDGTGPYGTLATCAPSDLDPIATGVLPTMSSSGKAWDGDSRDSEQDQVKGGSESGSKYGKDEQ